MLVLLERWKRQCKYVSAQDAPLWRTLLFILSVQKWRIGSYLLKKVKDKDCLSVRLVNPSDLCGDISRAIDMDERELWKYHEEFDSDSRFHQSIVEKLKTTKERAHRIPEYGWRELLYIVVRAVKPSIMIETGSLDGLGTAVILLGMDKNNKGALFAIDLPNPTLPMDIHAEPAWLVPDYLRSRLKLRKGTSKENLASVIKEAGGQLDAFYHDSWHTYQNMMFEYETVWSALRPGGLLMSEYLPNVNDAFRDFTKDKAKQPVLVANNTQFILVKP